MSQFSAPYGTMGWGNQGLQNYYNSMNPGNPASYHTDPYGNNTYVPGLTNATPEQKAQYDAYYANALGRYKGQQWDGSKWVSNTQAGGAQPKPYQSPYAIPTNIGQYEENILTNPYFLASSQQNPLGLQGALMASIFAQRKANEETEGDFQNALGALKGGQSTARNLYQSYGQDALSESRRTFNREQAKTDAGLQASGLYGSTLRSSLRNRGAEAFGRTQGAIRGEIATRRAGFEDQSGRAIADLYGARVRGGPSSGFYANLASAASTPGAVDTSGNSANRAAGQAVAAAVPALIALLSDERTKKNVKRIVPGDALNQVLALKGYSFEYIDPTDPGAADGRQVGVMAQEVERVFPSMVGVAEDGYKYVTMRGFDGVLIEAMRQIVDELNAVKAENVRLGNVLKRRMGAGV